MTRSKKINPNDLELQERKGASTEKNETYVGETSPTEMKRSFSQHFLGKTARDIQRIQVTPELKDYDTNFPKLPGM